MPEGLRKLDDILGFIITDRYLIGRTSEIIPVFEQLTSIHKEYLTSIENIMTVYLQIPHSRSFIEHVLIHKKKEMEYLRQKSQDLAENLEEDGLIPMAQEVVNFLNALLNYLLTASGKFINYQGQKDDLFNVMNVASFTGEESFERKIKTISLNYNSRTETGKLIQDDLGYKIYTLSNQLQHDWNSLVLAYEHLKFIKK
jgi:hypothetical protein